MRVVHVSHSLDGGAGRAAMRLHQSLRKLGADSNIFAFDQAVSLPRSDHDAPGPLDKFLAHYMKNIDKLPNKLHRCRPTSSWSNNWAPNFTSKHVMDLKPDVVNLHFIGAGTFPIRDFSRLNCPIVWTLHDMAAQSYDKVVPVAQRFRISPLEPKERVELLREQLPSDLQEVLRRDRWAAEALPPTLRALQDMRQTLSGLRQPLSGSGERTRAER